MGIKSKFVEKAWKDLKESETVFEILKDLAEATSVNYKSTLKQFLQFANSKKGLEKTILISDLVKEAKKQAEEQTKEN